MENLNVEAAIKMVKAGASEEEIKVVGIDKIVPMRKYVKGKAPTLNMQEVIKRMNGKAKMLEDGVILKTKWTKVNENITDVQKSELMGKVLEICIREILGNHVYIFDGQAYLQGWLPG